MHNRIVLVSLLMVAGCGDEPSSGERAASDARDIAMVEEANEVMPPVKQITPEPILLPDIERFDLLGEACNYAPGTSLGTRVIAREADAFAKIEGDIVRFAADPGSRELPMHTRTLYNGREYSLRLQIEGVTPQEREVDAVSGAAAQPQAGGTNYEGTVQLRDQYGRLVYEGTGLAQCKG
jgi:hypothetical protein